ncbi:glycosyltransferase family 2 protein [Oscillatoriales cyanobacterium LEGE 11467]|uniref:4,4'-diaponeurosporenoate glycosyltransferase n=1 Tax=Zarconia navalis LEGE 11467 TaxID=1828826 RepID=A0A928W1A8_9CYAN|nr:glycosyltransferase family 2 protein [Zarconia navalis]MBE9041450.1 glycosyltransferase family 2 protein [Zarconia navalis LEGE 11467]
MQTAKSLTISIVIPVYNGGKAFYKCLSSLQAVICDPEAISPHEIVVVSDGDTDGSWQLAEQFGAKVIRCATSRGPARARNIGARAATGDIVFFVDADVTVYPETIGRVVQEFERAPDLAALIGSYDDAPGAHNFLSQYKNLFHHYTHQTSSEVASTFWGACGAVRREVFLQLGGFDEKYRAACVEDIELGYRLKRYGHAIKLCKDIQVKHLKRWEAFSLLRAEIFYRALPWTALLLRNRALNNDLNLQTSSRVSVLLVYGLVLALALAAISPSFAALLPIAAVALGLINLPVYQFFHRKRGLFFALKVVPWHWFYFFYSGFAFAIGLARHGVRELTPLRMGKLSRIWAS